MTYALIIDDDRPLLDSLASTIRIAGFEVETASTWEEGLLKFQIHSPDLVVADYNLPNSRHGLQLLTEIRRLRPSVRVVLLSAYIDEQDVEEIEQSGYVDRALTKLPSTNPVPAILDEIRAAAEAADTPTDWRDFAAAHQRTDAIDQEALEELDQKLQKRRGIS